MTTGAPKSDPPRHEQRGLRGSFVRPGKIARMAISMIRGSGHVWRALWQFPLAVIIVFEEWGWRPLAAAIARLARFAPVARIEALIAGLPPYPALLVFGTPSLILFPLKLLSLWLIAGGHLLLAGLLFVGAKVVGTALVARIFQLTQPALMQLGWFRWAYETFMPWKEALVWWVRETWVWRYGRVVKYRIKKLSRAWLDRARPSLDWLRARFPGSRGRR